MTIPRFPIQGPLLADGAILNQMVDSLNGEETIASLAVTSLVLGGTTLDATDAALVDQAGNATSVGAVAAPVSGTTAVAISKVGNLAILTFTFTATRITVTDGAASGSHGATKIFDFVQQALAFQGARFNQVSAVEGAALTTGAGDAVYAIGIGTTAISAAADGVLAAANTNVSGSVAVTDSAGTGAGTLTSVPPVATAGVDGTSTASDLYLNWSGTAATIDANSTIDITGTATVAVILLGDD